MFTWTRLAASDFGENWAINLTLSDFTTYDLVCSGKHTDMDPVRIVVTLTEVTDREQGGGVRVREQGVGVMTHLASWSLDAGDTLLACKTAKDCKLGAFTSFYLQIVLEEGI